MDIKPTVYLIKDSVTSVDQIFKDADALDKTQSGDEWLYFKDSFKNDPKWLPFIRSSFTVDAKKFFNASAYATVILNVEGRYFAIPFGMGSHLVNMSMIEYNFGLKVAINCIPKNELRQLDLTTPETNSQKTKKQAVKSSTTEDFGVNKQKDILRGVAGKLPKDHDLGERIEGKDSVRISQKISNLTELKALCTKLLTYSQAVGYKDDYPWIDNMAIISDPVLLDGLYADLLAAMKANTLDHMYISTPEFVDDLYQYEGFVFTGNRKRKKNKAAYPFPSASDLIDDLGDDCIQALDRDALAKSCNVYLKDSQGELKFGWPLSRCLAWETDKDGSKYILSEGTWYKINDQFYTKVNDYFAAHVKPNTRLPLMPAVKLRESDYNHGACAADNDLHLFDLGHADARHRTITKDGNEICDIFDAATKSFIHVKVGKSSPDISHLFRQGVFSGHTLKLDATQLDVFKGYLTECGCDQSIIIMPYAPSDYKVIFAAILGATQRENISFFNKVSFKDAAELTLEMMGYQCEFHFIHSEPAAEAEPEVA